MHPAAHALHMAFQFDYCMLTPSILKSLKEDSLSGGRVVLLFLKVLRKKISTILGETGQMITLMLITLMTITLITLIIRVIGAPLFATTI